MWNAGSGHIWIMSRNQSHQPAQWLRVRVADEPRSLFLEKCDEIVVKIGAIGISGKESEGREWQGN
jgi:hypothetical protein